MRVNSHNRSNYVKNHVRIAKLFPGLVCAGTRQFLIERTNRASTVLIQGAVAPALPYNNANAKGMPTRQAMLRLRAYL